MEQSIIKYEVAEIQLSYKTTVNASERAKISSSRDAYNLLLNSWDFSKLEFIEQFKVLLLNRANKVLGMFEVSSGGSSGTVAEPKLIFCAAIKSNACGLILAHNHPSGNLQPSQSDIELTKQLREVGRLLEIPVLDHIVLTKESYYSFSDEGMI
jgi:DNA repair protein RadC